MSEVYFQNAERYLQLTPSVQLKVDMIYRPEVSQSVRSRFLIQGTFSKTVFFFAIKLPYIENFSKILVRNSDSEWKFPNVLIFQI